MVWIDLPRNDPVGQSSWNAVSSDGLNIGTAYALSVRVPDSFSLMSGNGAAPQKVFFQHFFSKSNKNIEYFIKKV